MSKRSTALSFSSCSATAKPSGMIVPMSASTPTSTLASADGVGAAWNAAGADETPQLVIVYVYGARGVKPVARAV